MQLANGLELQQHENGLLVRQYGEAYVARNWKLTTATIELVEAALGAGLHWLIRKGHPQAHARWPSTKGRVYLAFSPTQENQWSLAIDTFNDRRGDFGRGVFNGKYQQQFLDRGLPFAFEKRNKGAGHLVVDRHMIMPVLNELKSFDHSVLYIGRSDFSDRGFVTEYDIQRSLLNRWSETPFSSAHDVVADEYPIDGGLNSRRIDILAKDRKLGNWLVVEIKRAEASVAAIEQVSGYVRALGRKEEFFGSNVNGCVVAERVPEEVRSAARSVGVIAYEISYPLQLKRVA